ncbi:hypothetical protein GQ54DRAFT_308393 [Martensiomyces pterosporus]|nr:hypothetical protein GQ54DRAFT_308393 [Martensiomyces pterosporus]
MPENKETKAAEPKEQQQTQKESLDDVISKAASSRRFQRRPLTPEFLQEDYEQNMLGTSAGFFCAIWAGWLLGEPVSRIFTSFSYEDVDRDGFYYFGAKDIALSILLATKVLFVRALLFRYAIRPLIKALGVHPFERRQKLAEQIYLALILLSSVLASMCFLLPLSAGGLGHFWDSYPVASIPFACKVFVIVQCAYRISELIALYFEGEKRNDYYDQAFAHYFMLGVLGCLGLLGLIDFASLVLVCTDLPRLITAAADACQILSLAFVAAEGAKLEDGAVWTSGMRTMFVSTFVAVVVLGLRYTASLCSEFVAGPASDADARAESRSGVEESKKTQ